MKWMLLTLVYGVIKGTREIVKKKSLEKSTVAEVLFFYTLFGFILLLPESGSVGGVPKKEMFYIACKSFVIFIAWIASFHAIKKVPISLYGVLDLSRVLFSTFFGVVILGEILGLYQIIGLCLVALGLLMLKFKRKGVNSESEQIQAFYVICAFISCILNSVSALMDKVLTKDVTHVQLQYWYMLYLAIFYGLYLIFSKTKVNFKAVLKNYWIWILSILFIFADRCLFIANEIPASKVTVMTLIKQSGCIVTILAGKFIFKEKNIRYKLLCAAIIIVGIVISSAFA